MVETILDATQQLLKAPPPILSYGNTAFPNTVKPNIETHLEGNVNVPNNISQKSSPEFIIDISLSNGINETSIPSNIYTPLVTSVTNDNSLLTQQNILKIEAQLLALKNYVDCELSALTFKIDGFSDSIKNVLSDLQNEEHENSQIEVLKKNITLLQNEKKSKDTIIESLLETQKTLTKYLSDQIPKTFQSTEIHSQQQQRQHQHHHHHHQHQQRNPQSQAQQYFQQSQESNIAAQKTQESSRFPRNNLPHQNKFSTLYIGSLSDDITVNDLHELFDLHSTQYLNENSDIQMPLLGNTEKRRGFAYIANVVKELLKLHVIEFDGRKLVIERAKTPPKKTTGKKQTSYSCSHRQ